MKRHKLALFLSLIISVWIGSLLPMTSVEAGVSVTEVDQTTFGDKAIWNYLEDSVIVENDVAKFSKDSGQDFRFILRKRMAGESVVIECEMKLVEMEKDKSFILGLGLQGLEATPGSSENVEIAFLNSGGLKVGVSMYDENGKEIVLCAPKNCGISLKQNVTVRAEIDNTNQHFTVSVNGKNICSSNLSNSIAGRVGFLRTGKCEAEISKFKAVTREYARPENTNVYEDFENETWDLSKVAVRPYSASHMAYKYNHYRPGGVQIEEYNGNRVLMMRNQTQTYVSTTYQYSNFELSFDVPYIQRERVYDQNGVVELKPCDGFGVIYGVPAISNDGFNQVEAADKLTFTTLNAGIFSVNHKENGFSLHSDVFRPYWDGDKPFTVKVSVVDGTVTVGIKWTDEKDFKTLGSYVLKGGSPLGHVQFRLRMSGTMAIDNFKVVNLDENPNLIETEFQSGLINTADAEYEPFERIYPEKEEVAQEQADKKGMPFYYWLPLGTSLVGVVLLVTAGMIARRKRKREENKDEK